MTSKTLEQIEEDFDLQIAGASMPLLQKTHKDTINVTKLVKAFILESCKAYGMYVLKDVHCTCEVVEIHDNGSKTVRVCKKCFLEDKLS